MQRVVIGILIVLVLVFLLVFGFTVYGQFALDYSLESLRKTLELSRQRVSSEPVTQAYRSILDGLVLEEVSRQDADLKTVVFLEHASRSVREAVEGSGYARAGVYLSEVLREKSFHRNWFLQTADAFYSFANSFSQAAQDFWNYFSKRLQREPQAPTLSGAGVLILGEAERMEKQGELREAVRYYREFLTRYPDRPERGFVTISHASLLIKMRQLDEASALLEKVRKEFPGLREEALAHDLVVRIASVRKWLSRLPELEDWVKEKPERFFMREGGLELALGYIATFQIERALSVLKKLEEAPDPRLRAKAIFYQGLIHKWQGDLSKSEEFFKILGKEPEVEEELTLATQAQLADVHYEKKQYDQALNDYEEFARKAQKGTWRVLSELEQGGIHFFRLGNREATRESLERLKREFPRMSAQLTLAQKRLDETLRKSLREDGFRALREGRLDAAREIFKNHLEKFPQDGQVTSALASIALLQGFLEDAIEEAQRGYGLEPTEYTAAVLGYVYEKVGRLEEAEEYYSISTSMTPSYLTAKFNYATAQLITGYELARYTKSERLLAELEERKPSPPVVILAKVLNNRGFAFWGLGREGKAKVQFQKALKLVPDFPEAKQNLELAFGEKPIPAPSQAPIV